MATTYTTNDRAKDLDDGARPRKWQRWLGRVLSALPMLALAVSASLKLSHAPQFVATWTDKLGWRESDLTTIGLLELACLAIYAVPRTAFVGAILLSAYLGGAVATHMRVGEPFVVPVILGVLIWAGLVLRDERLRAPLLPRTS